MSTRLAACQLHPTYGAKIRTAPPGYNWYQHITYGFHDGEKFVTLPGRVQIRYRHKRTDVITCNDKGSCVMGTQLGWLIVEAGYELISNDRYWAEREDEIHADNATAANISYHTRDSDDDK